MEKDINKGNYEIWLIDYIDNNLTSAEREKVEIFLAANPDIKEEFDELEMLPQSESIVFEDKELLKKEIEDLIPDGFSSLDEFMVANLEGDLDFDQQKKFNVLIESDKSTAKDYSYYLQSKVKPDNSIIYTDKSLLKKTVLFSLPLLYNKYSSVVSIAAILIVLILMVNIRSIRQNILTSKGVALIQDVERQDVGSRSWSYNSVKKIKFQPGDIENNSHIAQLASNNSTLNTSGQVKEVDMEDNQQIQKQENDLAKQNNSGSNTDKVEPYDKKFRIEKAKPPVIAMAEPQTIPLTKYLTKKFRERALNEEIDEDDNKKFSGWDIADAGLQRIGKLFNRDVRLNKEYNEQGEIIALAYQSPNLGFTAPLKRNRP